MSDLWYPKCIHIYGCEIDYEVIFSLFENNEKYVKNGILTDDFYDDLSIGIFINNKYELRRYKVSMDPYVESYFLILDKIVLDITSTGNVKVEITHPNEKDINDFKEFISNYQLIFKEYIVVTG